jgi:hypothetical protein
MFWLTDKAMTFSDGARPWTLRSAVTAAVFSAALIFSANASSTEWRWTGVERIVAVSDIHGAYAAVVRTLQNAEVLGNDLEWLAGSTHLVVTGDFLDRGADSQRVMDLLIRLEGEAADAGGRVHVLLGNHEVMNLTGDLRYVSLGEYAAFVAEEEAADREHAFTIFHSTRGNSADEDALRSEFEKRAPPGYFGHRRAFAPQGSYGKWLLEKPLLIVINDTAFVHGGLSPMVTRLGLDGVNGKLRAQVSEYAAHLEVLVRAGIIDPTENFYRHAAVLGELPDIGRTAEIQQAIAGLIELNAASVHDSESPVWYRGNVGCSALIENDKLDAALNTLGAVRVVIGHTPTPGRQILQRLSGRVVEIDTGMLTASYGGSGHALVIESDQLTVVSEESTAPSAPAPHLRPAGPEANALSSDELEHILAMGDVSPSTADASGRKFVEIQNGNERIPAHFVKDPRGRGFVPELAAYRLDRLLDLDMVPVTVTREVDGDQGSLQFLPGNLKDEAGRSESGDGASAWCPLPEQWNAMYVFDVLAFNALRGPQSILYSPSNWQLLLVDHGEAFAARNGRPAWLKEANLELGKAWIEALSSLSDDVLQAELGDVLDKRRLSALGKRRDALLQQAEAAGR